jgi:signal transduction histidine kinase
MDSDDLVLIVDDDLAHRSLIERYVTLQNLRCKSAENGKDALKQMESETVSIVITDMAMPEMDGMALLKEIRGNYPDTNVIVMTGYSKLYSYIDVIREGASDFIEKPFRNDEFAAKLNRVFRERHLVRELKKAKEKAESGSKAKTAFLCAMSHELRTPMNGILGFTDLLANSSLPPPEKKYVSMVSQSADRLMKLINQILDFSTIEAGENDFRPSHFYLAGLFEELLVTVKPDATDKGLQLNLDISPDITDTMLFGDQLVLARILSNLIDNSIKASDSGLITISVKKEDDLQDDTIELLFSVNDQGEGVSPDLQNDIFEPFTQAEDYMNRKHEGAGLGLAICTKLVNMMNGRIWLESNPEDGTTFYFTVRMQAV